jgi:NADH dehydrogenase
LREQELGIPVVNLGLDGKVALNVIVAGALEQIRPGDTLLLIAEYLLLQDPDGFDERSATFGIAIGKPGLANVPLKQFVQDGFLLGIPSLRSLAKLSVDLLEKGKLTGYYSGPLNDRGDPLEVKKREGKWWQMTIDQPISQHAIDLIFRLKKEVEAKGGHLVVSLPWIYAKTDAPKNRKNVKKTVEEISKIVPLGARSPRPCLLTIVKNSKAKMQNRSVKKICILGGGFAGLYTALSLQKYRGFKDKNYQIILIDRHDHILFTPLLYEVVTDELKAWEIAPSFKKLIKDTSIDFYQDNIEKIDLKNRQVFLQERGTITYDYLVLAVGREAYLDEVSGVREHTLGFRTLADTYKLKQRLNALESSDRERIRVAVVGGGPSGVELATKIADRLGKRGEIRLITRSDRILKDFTPQTCKSALKALEKRNISISWESQVQKVTADRLSFTQLGESVTLPVDLVLWMTGTQARELVKNLDCQHNDRGQVFSQSTLQLVDYPEVFALGDVAEIIDGGGKQVPDMAQAAYQQASCAAKNINSFIARKRLRPFHYLHLGEMMTLGANDSAITSFVLHLHGFLAHWIRLLVYLQRMPTLSHRFQVLSHWLNNCFRWLKKYLWHRSTAVSRRGIK